MRTLVVGFVLVALTAPVLAQPERRGPGRGVAPKREAREMPPDQMSPAELHQLFDAMLVMQAQTALELDDERYAQFVSRVRALQVTRRRNQTERLRMINELQRLTNPRTAKPAPAGAIEQRLRALDELESRTAAELRQAYNAIDETLTPVQRARFRVLEEQIERRKLELVGRARNRPNQQRR